ncbi:MAG: hypothetical protein LBC85_02210 [Fibromonadaceae bacterium]|jgi:hypothetical protein|nr:hypothetical protein [Fibromonadaceae bacterium]
MKELLFRRFSLFAGLLALASVLTLSYFYYRIQADTPFAYWQVISNLYEYRVLDSQKPIFTEDGNFNAASLRDNLLIQRDLLGTTSQMFYSLREQGIEVPSAGELNEIERSIFFRSRWLKSCVENGSCDTAEWVIAHYKAQIACEKLLSDFYIIISEREHEWSKNLRLFYILSVMLLLSTLFFAAKRS